MTAQTVANLTVADALLRLPGAARIFMTRGLSCVGCAFAPFDTVADVARLYQLDPIALATDLLQADRSGSAHPKGLQ
jgi:hybrid cluster-associated redox disulfide protein